VHGKALPTMAWEGIATLAGGTNFGGGVITDIDASPNAAVKTYAMQV
jgi:hypothetical protein